MEWLGRLAAASLLSVSIAGCDCRECAGASVEVIDADTGDAVEEVEVVYAESIYAPRIPLGDHLPSGEYSVWARAPGYRDAYERVHVPIMCADEDGSCPTHVETIEMDPR